MWFFLIIKSLLYALSLSEYHLSPNSFLTFNLSCQGKFIFFQVNCIFQEIYISLFYLFFFPNVYSLRQLDGAIFTFEIRLKAGRNIVFIKCLIKDSEEDALQERIHIFFCPASFSPLINQNIPWSVTQLQYVLILIFFHYIFISLNATTGCLVLNGTRNIFLPMPELHFHNIPYWLKQQNLIYILEGISKQF